MELIFNELSSFNEIDNRHTANGSMENLVHVWKASRSYGFNKIKFRNDFGQISLTSEYNISDWLNDNSVRRDFKNLFLGIARHPYIEDGDEPIENKYISSYYSLNQKEIPELFKKEVEGLAVAFICNALAISFSTHKLWEKITISLFEKSGEKENIVSVRHMSLPGHIESHKEWLEENRPVELIKTVLSAGDKKINLRDDHGKDILLKYAKKLNTSPHVIETINSLPFNSQNRKFIKKCSPNGQIEIVLIWTDAGYGLIIQTTGRTLQETKRIAEKLEQEFCKKKAG